MFFIQGLQTFFYFLSRFLRFNVFYFWGNVFFIHAENGGTGASKFQIRGISAVFRSVGLGATSKRRNLARKSTQLVHSRTRNLALRDKGGMGMRAPNLTRAQELLRWATVWPQ